MILLTGFSSITKLNKNLIISVEGVLSAIVFFCILMLNFGFPVANPIDIEMMPRIPDNERLIYSIVCYVIWFSIIFTIPLYVMQYFKNQQFYENYIIIWLIASTTSAMLYNALIWGDWLPDGGLFVKHIVFILVLTLPPAIYQHQKS
ncbi:hypothetical protein [Methyloglobulus sp.]|uniref:hypothetical protein n=1 Tax=Methyloglobulus sp. TaxID=2518622 RepID=UPI0032B7306E